MLGDLPEGLFKQITLTFNPWNEKTWIKKRFFDVKGDENTSMSVLPMHHATEINTHIIMLFLL